MITILQNGNFRNFYQLNIDISNVNIEQSPGIITGSIFVTYNFLGGLENNAPPYLEGVIITGSTLTGSTLTAIPDGYFSRSGYPSGSHIYKWYNANNKQGASELLIQNSTSSQYIITGSDLSKYIRVTVIPTQVGGLNTTGSEISSMYTNIITT